MKLTSTFIRALLLLMALTATIMPQELENITVLPFEGWTGSDSRSAGEFQNAITDKIITRIVQTHRFDVIDRANLEKIILEQDLHLTGLIDEASVTSYHSWWPSGQLRVVREYEGGAVASEQSYDSDGIRYLTGEEIELLRRGLADYPGEPASPQDTVVMETSAGTIRLRLFTDVAPGHCNNFKRLANFGYYDSTTFHRVIPGFVIQGGDILSRDTQRSNDGQGGPGYTIPAEFNPRPHRKGTLAMARSRDPNSAGSQFYIALRRLPQLDNQYTVFGEVIDGIAIVDSMAAASTDSRGNPVQPQRILRVRVGKSETP